MTFAKTLPMMLRREMSVVVAVAPLSPILEKSDDLGVPHVLWYSSFLTALTKEYMQKIQ